MSYPNVGAIANAVEILQVQCKALETLARKSDHAGIRRAADELSQAARFIADAQQRLDDVFAEQRV